jgi:transposase
MKKRVYSATDIMHVDWHKITESHAGQECVVGVDVGKLDMRAVLRWADGSFERPWAVRNPEQVPALVAAVARVADGGRRRVRVAMESTGTYGDPLRQALADAGVETHLISGKRAHDYAEVFDGVPSQHDGKDAAVVAELCALGKGLAWPWAPPDEQVAGLTFLVDQLEAATRERTVWVLRLEAMLARHWPEASRVLKVGGGTMLRALAHYGGPAALAADADAAATLQRWGTRWLDAGKVRRVVDSAGATAGVRQGATDVARVQWCAAKALDAHREAGRCQAKLRRLGAAHAAVAAQGAVVGVPTACVLWRHLGDPKRYHCAAAYRKAMGLNLKERSSGKHRGEIKITKRGPGACRRWLHLAALRLIRDEPAVRAWYARKCGGGSVEDKGKGKGKGAGKGSSGAGRLRAVTALVRKLAPAMWVVGAGRGAFDVGRLLGQPARRQPRADKEEAGEEGGVAVAVTR